MSESTKTASRRWTGSLLVALLLGVLSLFAVLQVPAGAAVEPHVAARAATSAPYPPQFCPTISISTTHPFPGQTITIRGQGFDGGQALTLVMTPGDDVLGHVSTSAAGGFSTQVTLPHDVTGNRVIRAEGSGSDCPVNPIQIGINSNPTPTPQPPLPFTGVDILTALAIALALVGVGLLLTRGGRRSYRGAHGRH